MAKTLCCDFQGKEQERQEKHVWVALALITPVGSGVCVLLPAVSASGPLDGCFASEHHALVYYV